MVGPSELRMLVKKYIDAVKTHDVIFGVGPAGTGKPFSRGDGSSSFKKGEVQKIILTRPAVEAGESLGFYQVT